MRQNLQIRHFLQVLLGIAIILCIAIALLLSKNSGPIEVRPHISSIEECLIDDDCDSGFTCEEITSCPPCSEDSVDFPNNCNCTTQNTCIPF